MSRSARCSGDTVVAPSTLKRETPIEFGDIWNVDFGSGAPGEPAFVRPAVVVAPAPSYGGAFNTSFLVPLTTRHRPLDCRVLIPVEPGNGLTRTSWAQCDHMTLATRARFRKRIGRLSPVDMHQVRETIREILGF